MVRKVKTIQWQGQSARAIILQKDYPADIEVVWQAIVDPQRLSRWFLPVTGDLRIGGNYQLQGNAGGTIKQCDPPSSLAITWEMNENIGWVNINLEEASLDSTRLVLEHIAHEDAGLLEFWRQFGPGALGVGWDLGLSGLSEFLEKQQDYVAPGRAKLGTK